MPVATVEVRFVNPVPEGKKTGSIKGSRDEYFLVYPELLPQFQVGKVYELEYKTHEFKNQEYHTVQRILPRRGTQVQRPLDEELDDELPPWGGGSESGNSPIPKIQNTPTLKPIEQLMRGGSLDRSEAFAVAVVGAIVQGQISAGALPGDVMDAQALVSYIKEAKAIWALSEK